MRKVCFYKVISHILLKISFNVFKIEIHCNVAIAGGGGWDKDHGKEVKRFVDYRLAFKRR